jgi:threonyl-tRNA synthetase
MSIRARLSYRDDSEAYLGETKLWNKAQKILKDVVVKNKLDFYEMEGEAAFYGPKIDFMAKDALGREHQLATPQLDFVQPARFGLEYTNEKGEAETPVMIHFALMGSIERFLSVYIEHTAGVFPLWLAPEQVRVLPISEKLVEYANSVREELKKAGARVEIDDSNESLGKKIRNAELMKVPYVLVVGEKEQESNTIAVRKFGKGDLGSQKIDEFIATLTTSVKNRSLE